MKFILCFIFLFSSLNLMAQGKPGDGTLPVLDRIQVRIVQSPIHSTPVELEFMIGRALSKKSPVVSEIKLGQGIKEVLTLTLSENNEVQLKLESYKDNIKLNTENRFLSQNEFIRSSLIQSEIFEREINLVFK